jgi:hypothetical protein
MGSRRLKAHPSRPSGKNRLRVPHAPFWHLRDSPFPQRSIGRANTPCRAMRARRRPMVETLSSAMLCWPHPEMSPTESLAGSGRVESRRRAGSRSRNRNRSSGYLVPKMAEGRKL